MEVSEATALKSLLSNQPVAALATLHKGEPAISMVPFAMLPSGTGFVIHVSRLATHTNDMLANPAVALLVTAPLTEVQTPLALPRVSIQGHARQCAPESAECAQARAAYLAKLPDAEELFSFSDFSLFIIEPDTARYVAGFGRAMSLTSERLQAALKGEWTMSTGTVRLHRVLRAAPERVYQAFLDADAMAKWIPPYGFTCKVHHLDARVGGTFRMSFTNFNTGNGHSFGGEYLELVPNERIRYTDKFDDPNLPGEIQVTVSLAKVSCGTEINIVQEGLPEVIPLEMCYLGWQESLAQLATLVEPEIPD